MHSHTNYFTGKLLQLPINQQKSQNFSTSNDLQYVTGFWKTNQIVTLALFNFIGLANSYMHTLPILIVITRLGWLVCFSRASITNHVDSHLIQWDPCRALHRRHGFEVDPSSSEMSLRPSKYVSTYGWNFLDSQLVQTV